MKEMLWYLKETETIRDKYVRQFTQAIGANIIKTIIIFFVFKYLGEMLFVYLKDYFTLPIVAILILDSILWIKYGSRRIRLKMDFLDNLKKFIALLACATYLYYVVRYPLGSFRVISFIVVSAFVFNFWAKSNFYYHRALKNTEYKIQNEKSRDLEREITSSFYSEMKQIELKLRDAVSFDFKAYVNALKFDTNFVTKKYKNSEFSVKAMAFLKILDAATSLSPDATTGNYLPNSKYQLMHSLAKGYSGEDRVKNIFDMSGIEYSSGDNFLIPPMNSSERNQILEVDFMVVGDGIVYLFESKDFAAEKIVLESSGYFYKVDKYGNEHKLETLNQANRQRNLIRTMLGRDVEIKNCIVLSDNNTKIVNNMNMNALSVLHVDALAFFIGEIKQKDKAFQKEVSDTLQNFRKDESMFDFFDIDAELDYLKSQLKDKVQVLKESSVFIKDAKQILENPIPNMKKIHASKKTLEMNENPEIKMASDLEVEVILEVIGKSTYHQGRISEILNNIAHFEKKIPSVLSGAEALLLFPEMN